MDNDAPQTEKPKRTRAPRKKQSEVIAEKAESAASKAAEKEAEKPKRTRASRTKKSEAIAETPGTVVSNVVEQQTEKPKRTRTPRKKKSEALPEVTAQPASKLSAEQSAGLDRLIDELNSLAEELKRTAKYTPPPFSPQAMAVMLRDNIGKFAPDLQVPILSELKQNLEGTKPEDLLNPDTWKGMWYILNYTAQAQSDQLKAKLVERLSLIPGASVIFDLKNSFEGAKPSDFLDINTWKGVAFILDHTIRTQASELKKKLLGEEEA